MIRPNFNELTAENKPEFTNIELYRYLETLKEIEPIRNVKLWNAINTTIHNIQPYYDLLTPEKLIPKSIEFSKFEEEKNNIMQEFSEGKTVTKNIGGKDVQVWDLKLSDPEKESLFLEKILSLEEKYKDILVQRAEDLNEYNSFMLEAFTVKDLLVKIPIEVVKDEDIPLDRRQSEAVYKLIQ